MIELTGSAISKIISFACAAGGMGSYMSVISDHLILDFRCVILPCSPPASTYAA